MSSNINMPMITSSFGAVDLLANKPHLIPAIGEMRWREWGHPPEPNRLEWWVETTAQEAGRDSLPITWVALDDHGQALGAVGLGQFDIDERRDRSPWVMGMIVTPQYRATGIGRQLMQALESWAGGHGYSRAWVATEQAAPFYRKCGWELTEIIERASRETMSILTKSLSA